MGFWDSLVEGTKAAGGWVLDHAGDISTAVGTVAKIAGAFALDSSGEPDHQSHLADFHTNFKIASGKLQQRARRGLVYLDLKADRYLNADEFAAEDAVLDSFTGIWTDPVTLSPGGLPAIPMYQDLSKWLATLGVPPNIDAATPVAQALFADADEDESNVVENDPVQTISFRFKGPGGKWILDTAHAYYTLPLGASAGDKSWHSCIYAKFQPSISHVAGKRQRMHATTSINKITTDEPTWMINATITWGNVQTASKVSDLFLRNCKRTFGTKSDRGVVSSNLLGVSQSIQVQGNKDDNPSILQSLLNGCASETLTEQVTSPPDDNNDWENLDITLADGTDAIHDKNSAPLGKGQTTHWGPAQYLVAESLTKQLVPVVMPKFTITSSQLIFPPTTK